MIRSLTIHRFRGIREGVLDDLGKLNVLIGPNNSGKTSILELLYLGGLSGVPCELITENIEPSAWTATLLSPRDLLALDPVDRLRRRHGYADEAPRGFKVDPDRDESWVHTLNRLPPDHPLRSLRLATEEVVRRAPDDTLREVFAPLIAAWDRLAPGEAP